LSDELREKVIALGVAREKSRVILNGVDTTRFHYLDRDACRQKLGLPAASRILISVGRLTRKKGHHELIRIMPELLRTGPTHLYLIGGVNREEDYGSVLREMISELGLQANVHFIDGVPQSELAAWYAAADLFCLATMTEGCPNVVLEALACGTPVVATNAGAIGELITPGENGAIVHSHEIAKLGEIVRASLERQWDRKRIAARMEAWSWSSCAEQVLEVYRNVLQPQRVPCAVKS